MITVIIALNLSLCKLYTLGRVFPVVDWEEKYNLLQVGNMNEFEKEFDDEVYEDSFYEEEEELEDEETDDFVEEDDEVPVVKVDVSFACDDCDYRWDDVVVRRKNDYDDDSDGVVCPMCGSMNVTQI